jgi:hypothetical protein
MFLSRTISKKRLLADEVFGQILPLDMERVGQTDSADTDQVFRTLG